MDNSLFSMSPWVFNDTAAKVHTSIWYLCDAREKRFLDDLIQEAPLVPDDHPFPELYALLLALEQMWGGESAKQLTVPPVLMYDLVTYATYAHHMHEDVEAWRSGAVPDVYHILQGVMESVALAVNQRGLAGTAGRGRAVYRSVSYTAVVLR